MPPGFLLATILLILLQIAIPKRWAFLPLLIASCHLGNIEIAANLTACRFLIVVGILRAMASGELSWSYGFKLDRAFLFFAIAALAVSMAPRLDIPSPFRQNVGLILNVVGTYLYGRAYVKGPEAVKDFAKALVIVLIPLALSLAIEAQTRRNFYHLFGARSAFSMIREGRNRAMGPFQHPILAGTVGAVSFPIILVIWKTHRKQALLGLIVCLTIVLSSASSGPAATVMVALFALYLWRWRTKIRLIQKVGLTILIIAHLTSTRGVWYLMAHMDLAGGSTGYHRAKLIDSAIADFNSWWLAGTDYTRGWMFSGVSWSDRHTDITNYYLQFAVIGGLPLLIAFVLILFRGFRTLGTYLFESNYEANTVNFQRWCIGSALFAHAVSFLSVSYFDQMYVHFYLLLGLIPSVTLMHSADEAEEWETGHNQAGFVTGNRTAFN